MHRAMGNVDSVPKKFKTFSSFFEKNWPEKQFCQKLSQHAAQLNGVSSNNEKILAFSSLLLRQDCKVYSLPSKKSEIANFHR